MAKPKTQWFPANRQGTVVIIPNNLFVDNLGNFIVDNTTNHNNLVTTTLQIVPKPATAWTAV